MRRKDFTPSADLEILVKHFGAPSGGMPQPPSVLGALLEGAVDLYGADGVEAYRSLRDIDPSLQTSDAAMADLSDILDEAQLEAIGGADLEVLAFNNTLAEIAKALQFSRGSTYGAEKQAYLNRVRAAYVAWVKECTAARAEKDLAKLEKLRCKRDKHIMVPQGRLGLQGQTYGGWKGQEHPAGSPPREWQETDPRDFSKQTTTATDTRWVTPDRPYSARTQSLGTYGVKPRRRARVDALARKIISAVDAYPPFRAATTEDFSVGVFDLKTDQGGLAAHLRDQGIPLAAIAAIESMGLIPGRKAPDVFFQLNNRLGNALRLTLDLGLRLDLKQANLRRIRSPFRSSKAVMELLRTAKYGMSKLGRSRNRSRPLRKDEKRIQDPDNPEKFVRAASDPQVLLQVKGSGDDPTSPSNYRQLDAILKQFAPDRPLAVTLVWGGEQATVDLQHSDLGEPQGRVDLPDYNTLRGLSLEEAAYAIAKRLIPRKRGGLKRKHLVTPKARENPVSKLEISPMYAAELGADIEPGGYRALTPGAALDPPRGRFLYMSHKPGAVAQNISAKRLNSWLATAKRGRLLAKEVKAQKSSSAKSNPTTRRRAMGRRRRKSRRNPATLSYHDRAFASDSVLNKHSDSWYYPGTLWDWYAAGNYGPGEAIPVNRRNPRNPRNPMNPAYFDSEGRKQKGKVKDMPTAQRQMWKKGFVQRKVFGSHGPESRGQLIKQAVAIYKQINQVEKTPASFRKSLFAQSKAQLLDTVARLKQGDFDNAGPTGQQSMPGMGGADAGIVAEYKAIMPKGKARTIKGMKRAIAQFKKKQAASNPAYWPKYAEYRRVMGPYGAHRSAPIPVNRRNPAGKTITARWAGTCAVTGRPYKRGDLIADSGQRGPKGGKKMMLVESM